MCANQFDDQCKNCIMLAVKVSLHHNFQLQLVLSLLKINVKNSEKWHFTQSMRRNILEAN